MRLIILTRACKGLLISDRCHVCFAILVIKKRGVRDDINFTWTNLKIVRLGIARTHGWVELAPTVPTSSSHRSSTVYFPLKFCASSIQTVHVFTIIYTQRQWKVTSIEISIFRKICNTALWLLLISRFWSTTSWLGEIKQLQEPWNYGACDACAFYVFRSF